MKKTVYVLALTVLVLTSTALAQSTYDIVENIRTDFYAPNLNHTYDYVSIVEFFTWDDGLGDWSPGMRIGTRPALPDLLSWAHTLPPGLLVPPDNIDLAELRINANGVDETGNTIEIEGVFTWDPLNHTFTDNSVYDLGDVDIPGFWNNSPLDCTITAGEAVLTIERARLMMDYTLAPEVTCPGNQVNGWQDGLQSVFATATQDCADPSILTYSISDVTPPLAQPVTVDGSTGEIIYDPDCADIYDNPHVVTVAVDDGCGNSDMCSFEISVTNDAPVIACPADVDLWYAYWGELAAGIDASDSNGDPVAVTIAGATKNGSPEPVPAGMTVSPDGTEFSWDPDDLDEGLWAITLLADDGCLQTTCEFSINVEGPFTVCIDSVSVLSGLNATVNVTVHNAMPVGGFDLLIAYDPTLQFLAATPVGDIAEWEYFTFRQSEEDNCGGGCPTGILRLIGIADMPDGAAVDDGVFLPDDGAMVELVFATPQDLSYIGQCFHLGWTWYDCGDNGFASKSGDLLFVATDIGLVLTGDDCLAGDKGYIPKPWIDFCDGIICIVPPEDDRGDINLNGIPNEIADAVVFANYFIFGPGALGEGVDQYYDNRVLATDINDNGTPLTVADLVYLIRIITGDASPYPESGEGARLTPNTNTAEVIADYDGESVTVTTSSPANIGAAAFIIHHDGLTFGTPVLAGDAGMTLRFSDRDGTLRVLVYSMEGRAIPAGRHDLFTIPSLGNGTFAMDEVQLSDSFGAMLTVDLNSPALPAAGILMQNYPNPFNVSTTIRFALHDASDWNLSIYNITGQLVDEFTGYNETGTVTVNWEADVASGIYFYKLTTDELTETRKMILMK